MLRALFPSIRQEILAAAFTQPDRWWYLSELAEHAGTTPSSLQRELASLTQAGILERRREGTRTYYRAEKRLPTYRELRSLFEKSAGLVPTIALALMPWNERIALAFVHGSVARGTESAGSDIDVLIVGDLGMAEIASAVRKAEKRLDRDINAAVYSPREFAAKLADHDHFLSTVVKKPKQFIKGTPRELERIAGR